MSYSKQNVADMLRRAGFHEAADDALVELPDPVDLEQIAQWGLQRGITRDVIISKMGGSP